MYCDIVREKKFFLREQCNTKAILYTTCKIKMKSIVAWDIFFAFCWKIYWQFLFSENFLFRNWGKCRWLELFFMVSIRQIMSWWEVYVERRIGGIGIVERETAVWCFLLFLLQWNIENYVIPATKFPFSKFFRCG